MPDPSATDSPRAGGMGPGVASLLSDVSELVELQAKLLAADMRATVRRTVPSILGVVVGAVAVLGSMPVVLMSLADALERQFDWPRWGALLTSGGIGLAVGVALLLAAYCGLRKLTTPLERSANELGKNLASLREIVTRRQSDERPKSAAQFDR